MAVKKKNNVIAMLLAVLMVIAMMPMMTQEAYAGQTNLDFTEHVNGLKDGKIESGSTIYLNVEDTFTAYEQMLESFFNYGDGTVDVYLSTYAPTNIMVPFSYDSSTGIASLDVTADIASVGYFVNICIAIGGTGGDLFFTPAIDVVEKPAAPKVANTLAVAGKTATVKYKKLKKKNQYLDAAMAFAFANEGQGVKTYSLVSVKKGKKSFKKYFRIDASTGKVMVKKKLKKGTYKMKVAVLANGDAAHDPSAVQTVTVKIKVK